MNSSPETEANITVQIKYLSAIRDQTGCQQEEVGFPPASTLGDVFAWLNGRYGLALPNPCVMVTLNGRGWEQYPAKLAIEVRKGDVICLFPPIAGG